MKKRFLLIPTIGLPLLTIVPAINGYSNATHKKVNKSTALTSTNDQANANISYELVSTKKRGLNCGYKYENENYLNWNEIEEGSEKSFNEPKWLEPGKLWINTDGESGYDRFIYQQIRVNVNVPANTTNYNVQFQAEATEWWHWNCHFCGSQYNSSAQMFDLGDDINNHPEKFNNIPHHNTDMDSHTFMQHGWSESGGLGRERSDIFTSNLLTWSFNNDTSESKTFSKYIGVSFWVRGVKTSTNGDIWSDLKIGFRSSIDASGEIVASLQKWGDIRVECRLTTSDSTCHLTKYVDGTGTLIIPDHVTFAGKDYYVREIPSNWSDGENDITGLKFDKDVSHLKKICDSAFKNTNCLDYYINHKDELLIFPEGLEEIGKKAFYGTDWGAYKISGYSFPSTLKQISEDAFSKAPYIDGDDNNGVLEFRSNPEIADNAFCIHNASKHSCKWIYGNTLDLARSIHDKLWDNESFTCSDDYLIPRLIGDDYYKTTEVKFGDITAKCGLTGDECQLINYVEGEGTFKVLDHIDYDNRTFYIKEIPNNWSHGENDITGLKFEDDVTHLKIIGPSAFEDTNCLDYYINNKKELLVFPEGLEEIDEDAFYGTDYGTNKIRGYSFPSTLKKIGGEAFCKAPNIDGDNENGELTFKSVPNIAKDSFHIEYHKHSCKYIYGSTFEIANQIIEKIKKDLDGAFLGNYFNLCPRIISQNAVKVKFGDITVECVPTGDECFIQKYIEGKGTLVIPDHIEHEGKEYYIKQILPDWSYGESNITGVNFNDCKHLKKIARGAFVGTKCLNECIEDNSKLLEFPEGLEEIGECAFNWTSFGKNKVKGYSFPSTLKKIENRAFGDIVPYIDGDDNNGELHFKSIPEIDPNAFFIYSNKKSHCKYISAETQEMANQLVKLFRDNMGRSFDTGSNYLIPIKNDENKI